MRAILDPNVLIASLLSRSGPPARIVPRWLGGELELVVSEALIAELERALANPKVRERVAEDEAAAFVALLRHGAAVGADSPSPARRSADPGDDYLLALAEQERAVLVSGDQHLLALTREFPIQTARAFLAGLET